MYNEKEINEIRGKIKTDSATKKELKLFLKYVDSLEDLVREAASEDFYGTEGSDRTLGFTP